MCKLPLRRCHTAGTVLAIGAAVTTVLALLAVGPKSEPALIVAMWFHSSSLLTIAVALTVESLERRSLKVCYPSLVS